MGSEKWCHVGLQSKKGAHTVSQCAFEESLSNVVRRLLLLKVQAKVNCIEPRHQMYLKSTSRHITMYLKNLHLDIPANVS